MIGFILTVLKVIILLGFLILIHEGGHFLVAKLCKVKVNEFAIGFGPTIWKSKNTKTKYALRLIPLGGFVSMEGEEERSDAEGSFSKTSIPKRIAIVMAGGLVNIVFGLLVYFILVSATGNYVSQVIDEIQKDYLISKSEIQIGDEIVKIDNKRIRNRLDIEEALKESKGNEVNVTVKRNDNLIDIKVLPTEEINRDTGIYLGKSGEEITSKIIAIYPNTPAEKSGIEVNDVILKINGKDVNGNAYKVREYIQENTNETCIITVERKGNIYEYTITPKITSTYLLGVKFKMAENSFANNVYYGFWDTVDFSRSIVDNLKMMLTGKVNADQFMGPIGISGIVAETKAFSDFIYILALISLSLGVTNLLPFPPLDGGKVVIYIIEAIRRKPMKEKVEATIQMIGFAVLIGLSIYVSYNDILRIF